REFDVPASVVRDYAALADDEQSLANGYIVEQDHPRFGREKVVGLHVQLSETPGELSTPAPELGRHTLEVLRQIGIPEARLRDLEANGVIACGEGVSA
ncbi:MAG TPA: CoA transferase, partial [Tepidiformaceae bacterium]|nr:CoA transferase [Tepidiformaceae bacterium]